MLTTVSPKVLVLILGSNGESSEIQYTLFLCHPHPGHCTGSAQGKGCMSPGHCSVTAFQFKIVPGYYSLEIAGSEISTFGIQRPFRLCGWPYRGPRSVVPIMGGGTLSRNTATLGRLMLWNLYEKKSSHSSRNVFCMF